jgi:hypothetical protein
MRRQEVKWDVQTLGDGNLRDARTGVEVNSLFWEAEQVLLYFPHRRYEGDNVWMRRTVSTRFPSSPPCSRSSSPTPDDEELFDPTQADLTEDDSELLSIDNVTM